MWFDVVTNLSLQIILKSTVHPYRQEEMTRTDAFRAPLASAFKLHLDEVSTFRDAERSVVFS